MDDSTKSTLALAVSILALAVSAWGQVYIWRKDRRDGERETERKWRLDIGPVKNGSWRKATLKRQEGDYPTVELESVAVSESWAILAPAIWPSVKDFTQPPQEPDESGTGKRLIVNREMERERAWNGMHSTYELDFSKYEFFVKNVRPSSSVFRSMQKRSVHITVIAVETSAARRRSKMRVASNAVDWTAKSTAKPA